MIMSVYENTVKLSLSYNEGCLFDVNMVVRRASLSSSNKFGGHNFITYGWDFLLITVLALLFYFWGVQSGRYTEYMREAERVKGELVQEEKNEYIFKNKVV
ncbi:hypothetical protein AALF16_14820 [Bacillus cereus]|uniref:hypothetical protein n=1 Tax=Bacillus cereus TaxID=1396 RepID=UPI00356E5106